MGPNIMPLGKFEPIERVETAPVILKLEDNISTDHIMPAGAKILPFRSNIEKLSSFDILFLFWSYKLKLNLHT